MRHTLIALAIPFALLATSPAAAQQVASAVEKITPKVIEYRHHIHQNPELSNREFKTAAFVADHLRSLGMEVRTGIAHTGVVGILKGGRPGPIVAVRADMDALPVTEENDLPWKSTVKTTYLDKEVGVMHACGHDIHVAVQMGVASVLAGMRDQLPGTVMFIFQPAEEGAPAGEEGGAELMLKEGVFKELKPAAIFGLHADASMDVGKIGYTPGAAMAASDSWEATITGQQSHGGYPHLGIDPVVMASQAVIGLQTIRSRNINPLEPGVVTVGIIRGGERMNIIPMEVKLAGTVRTFDKQTQDLVERRMNEILDGITKAGGGKYSLSYNRGYPVTVNDTALIARMRPTLLRVMGASNVLIEPPVPGAEDFSYFAQQVPGFFYWLGVQKPGTTSGGHHTPTFMADDAAIPIGINVMTNLVLDYLRAGSRS